MDITIETVGIIIGWALAIGGFVINRQDKKTSATKTLSETVTKLGERLDDVETESIEKDKLIAAMRTRERTLEATINTQAETITRLEQENVDKDTEISLLVDTVAELRAELDEVKAKIKEAEDTGQLGGKSTDGPDKTA